MAKSTKTTYKPAKKGNYKSVVRMAEGGNVSELDYSERREYIEENYAPFITDAQMIFSIYDSGIEYDYKGDRKQVTQSIIEQYKSLADYTESTLPQETIYEIQDWDLVRKEIDPDTDEVIGETPLEQVSSDNTYNFSYNGLVDLNWRVYHDEEYDRFFYVIMPHLGGDIRGNYGDAIILEGNDKEELFYRFYEGFISGGASIYIKFKDGSEIGFDSEQDSDVFYFRVNEVFEPTGMAQKYLNDFEKFDSWKGDEFLEETIDIYLARNGVVPMMMAGGSLNDENPMAYIQILGYDEGKYFNLTDYADGQDVINGIYEWMNGLNEQFGGNREEYEVTDYEGFGDDLYDAYMGENEFDEIIEAYEKYQSSDFPADVISAYKNDSGSRNDSLSDVIDEMDNNYFGKYENLKDFGYEMVQQGVYEPSENDVYITDTDKRIIAGEEADSKVDDMRFEDLMDVALDTQSDYENEKSELEDKISEIQSEIDDLTDLQSSVDDDDEYETIAEQIEEKEVELDDVQNELDNIDSRFEDEAREEARELFYDEIYNKLENDLEDWLYEYGYNTGNLADVSFLSIDYEKIGDELSSDYLIVEFDGSMYFFNNYSKGGRIMASKIKPKFDYYIVENNTKKLVSGYSTKGEAIEQRKLLVKEYPSMRFEIFTLGNLEKKTDLDVYAKKDYVELSTLDKIKKVSVDAYRYGKEKVEQTNEFLKKHDVKGRIKRGARKVTDKTKQGGNWLKKQWREADFGDGTGRARFFADGGGVESLKVGSKVGFLRPRTGRYEYAEVLSIDGNNVNLVVRHPKRSQWDNYFTETKERITKFLNTPSEDWKDGRPVFKVKYADGGGVNASVPINESKAEKWYYRLKESDRIHLSKKYPKNDNETNEDWFQKVWIESGKSIGIKRNKYADGGGVELFRPTKEQKDEMKNEPFNPNILMENHEDFDNLKSDLNKYKNVDIRFKLIPNDGSEEDGDENDLSLNYIGEIYGGGIDSDEPFVELGFQVNDKYADGGSVDDNKIISTYYVEEDETGEKMKLIKQSVYSKEKLEKALKDAKEKTFEYTDKGLYLFRNEVYVHPKKAQKPYLDKYKVSFETFSSGSEVRYKKQIDKPLKQKEIYAIKNENGWVLGYRGSSSEMYFSPHTMPITFTSKKIAQEFVDRNVTKNPFIQKGIIVKLYADGGSLDGELFKVHYLKVFEDGKQGDTVFVKEIYGKNENEAISKFKKTHGNYKIEYVSKYADGGGVAQLPPKGELTNKDNLLLKYQKNGSEYEFYIYEPVTKNVSAYQQNKYLCKNKDCPIKMTYNQFINYLYTETYLDDLKYENGGGVGKTQTQLDAYKFVDEIVEIYKDKKKVKEVILDRVNSAYGRTSNQFVDSMWDRYNMIFYKEDYPHLFDNGGGVGNELNIGTNIEFLQDIFVTQESDEYDSERGVGGKVLKIVKKDENNNIYYLKDTAENLTRDDRFPYIIGFNKLKGLIEGKSVKIHNEKYAKGGGVSEYDIEILKKKYSEMNVSLNTKTGQVYVGGIKPNNKLYSDDKGYYLIDGYGKFMNKKYPIKKYFNHLENTVLSYYMNDKFKKGGETKVEYDVYDNKRMLENQANEIEHHSEELSEQVKLTKKVPAWVVAKMERATTDLSDITHYLDGENKMAHGGNVVDVTYEVLPHINKFIVAKVTYKQHEDYTYPSKEFIYGFNDKLLEFDDIKSAQKFIDNIVIKYPFGGVEKASYGAILLASQFAQKQQPQQIVYYIPQQQQEPNTGIIQNIPEMANGGDVGYDDETINDFCITNLIELANELQSVRYYVTNRFKESDFESKTYKGRLTIVFKEPASINVINSLSKFLERAEDCHHIFEQSVNVSGSEANGLSINLLSDKFSDFEFGKGGKVYDFAPKKINISKTKKITTHLGDFNLALITKDFVYFVNMEESDENGNTMMYNKNGELLSDNYFASNELHETLEKESAFDFIHPMMEIQRQEILKEN